MAKIDMGLITIAGIIYDGIDRKEACDRYLDAFPEDDYAEHMHVVVSDDNVDDYFIFSAIAGIASALMDDAQVNLEDERNKNLRRQFRFLVSLLDLPLPDWWDKDE